MIARLIACLMLLLAAGTANAAAPPWPEGVWRGTIGTLPVQACLERDGLDRLHGSYFYLKNLRPIALSRGDGQELSEPGGAVWALARGKSGQLGGTWRMGKRSLVLRLSPVTWKATEIWEGPCGSAAFIAPRLKPITVTRKPVSGPLPYDELHYDVGPAFDTVAIASFALPAKLPGDNAINAAVALDPLKPGYDADFLECMAGALSSNGTDGDYDYGLLPVSVRGDYLTVSVGVGYYCGGAHPDSVTSYRTFDRRSGAEFAIRDWLNPAAFTRPDGDDNRAYSVQLLTPQFRQRVFVHFPKSAEDPDDCAGIVAEAEYWSIALTSAGLSFEPSLPHVAQACGDSAIVPFAELGSYLSDQGKAGVKRIGSSPP